MKTYYEILDVPPTADAETIKKAFRREIAKYHPDKVVHLGKEFQEMAAVRAAELTVAYKTLTDAAHRADYDAGLIDAGAMKPAAPPPPAAQPPVAAPESRPAPEAPAGPRTPPPPTGRPMFETERAGRDVILRRAMAIRVQTIVEQLYGATQKPTVRGFDLALVPVAPPRLFGSPPPRVLMKMVDTADARVVNEAWSSAAHARVHAGKSPVAVLLFAKHFAPAQEVQRAIAALHRQVKAADGPSEIAVVVIEAGTLKAHVPPEASDAIKKLVDALRA